MDIYEQQAQKFLDETGAKIEFRYLKFDFYFPSDKEKRDIWEFRITRGNRCYRAMFGDSVYRHYDLINTIFGGPKTDRNAQYYINELLKKNIYGFKMVKYNETIKELSEWGNAGTSFRPTAYCLLSGINKYEVGNIDDFAREYGYTKPSEVIKAWKGCNEEWNAVQNLFTDEEIEKLREIN